jgi:drug/metabolite transporter (DMT)-like permease
MLVLGALGMWICGAFVYIGAHTTSATNIGLIYAATPVGIAVISTRLAKASLPPGQRRAMILSLIGVVFVIARGDPDVLLSVRLSSGDLWIVAAAASWVAYSVLQPAWPSVLTPMQRLTCITAGGLVILLPLALAEAYLQHYTLSARALALIVLAGLLPGFFSYTAYSYMIRELGAARAGLVTYLAPVYAALTAWWILGEPPRWFHLAGAALILPSIYIATRTPRRDGA